uniref:Keratin n=1 Tax=Pelodiscus sinensis TaxID=13735 RepID=K7F9M0_PELSI
SPTMKFPCAPRCYPCPDICPEPCAYVCNEPCVTSCGDSTAVVYAPPVAVRFPGPILATCPQDSVVGTTLPRGGGSGVFGGGSGGGAGGLGGLGGGYCYGSSSGGYGRHCSYTCVPC